MRAFLSRINKLESNFKLYAKKPLKICFSLTEEFLVVSHINVGIDEIFNWNGSALFLPYNKNRFNKRQDSFILNEEYLKAQPEISASLKNMAKEFGKELSINESHL